ncbi:MAG TPA: rod shape-determining protein RodA [Actinomycetota bacterium]|jgi:rod shape determining protein RodA|nr:rod shape-determining protein RodA [Actinomycetota bacterium]
MALTTPRTLGGRSAAAIRHIDLVSLGAVAALVIMGLLAVFTATVDPDNPGRGILQAPSELFNRQLVFCVIGAVTLIVAIAFDYRIFKVYAGVMYIVTVLLLLVVLTPLAENVKGSQRWISLGVLKLQPSELAKPVLICMLAAYISERRGFLELRDVFRCIGLTAPLALLVFLQPDFGTMLVLAFILLVMLVIGGADWRQLLVIFAIGVIGVFGLFKLGIVHDYQAARLKAFLDPDADPTSTGYNYRLTRQAIGNGGLTGTGILPERDVLSLTTNLEFVPERHTDFVFTVIAEQMGFLGGATILLLYGVLFVRGLRGAGQARDLFGTVLATGIVGYLTFQVFVNIGMTVGLVPITGIPLPFVSYGGSSLVSSALSLGILLSVQMRRFARPIG